MRLSVRVLTLPLIAVLAVAAGCDSGGSNDPEPEPGPAPVVASIAPTSGRAGTAVTITGEHFGETASANTVTFNGTEADVTSASATELVATVPQGAGSGSVEVSVGGQSSAGPDFTYIQPAISSVSPLSGPYGTEVSIVGTHFSETASENIVTFNGVEATITQATATQLAVEVPKNAGSGPVAVEVAGDRATGIDFSYVFTYTVSTYAGDGTAGSTDGSIGSARFNSPTQTALGPNGNLFVADHDNHVIRKITPDGTVSTFAGETGVSGYVNATGNSARFHHPFSVAVDAEGNVYVADALNHAIRKITPDGEVTTFAGAADGVDGNVDGTGTDARFNYPAGLALGEDGTLYVADYVNSKIRTISPSAEVATLAGSGTPGYQDGPAAGAQFYGPFGLTLDADGSVYVADSENHRVRVVSPSGEVSTLAGSMPGHADGTGTDARFDTPSDMVLDADGNLYVTDRGNHLIRKITPEGAVTTVAGKLDNPGFIDGEGANARFNTPVGMMRGANGHLYVTDLNNNALRTIAIE